MITRKCLIDGRDLPPTRKKYCSDRCATRGAWIAKYGLSSEDYATLLGESKCVICGRKMRRVHVDHDHKLGIVRGLVCSLCNRKVLTVIQTPIQAFNLLQYLVNPPASQIDGKERKVGAVITARDLTKRRRYYR